jgi:hypothetical protein
MIQDYHAKQIQGSFGKPQFKEDGNCKNYLQWGELKLKDVIFNLVQWLSITYPLKRDLLTKLFCCMKGENGGWVHCKSKSKTRVSSWVEKVQKANLNQRMDKGLIRCHHLPRLYLF